MTEGTHKIGGRLPESDILTGEEGVLERFAFTPDELHKLKDIAGEAFSDVKDDVLGAETVERRHTEADKLIRSAFPDANEDFYSRAEEYMSVLFINLQTQMQRKRPSMQDVLRQAIQDRRSGGSLRRALHSRGRSSDSESPSSLKGHLPSEPPSAI